MNATWSSLSEKDCLKYGGELVGKACGFVPDITVMSFILFFGTYSTSMCLKKFKTSPYFPTTVSNAHGAGCSAGRDGVQTSGETLAQQPGRSPKPFGHCLDIEPFVILALTNLFMLYLSIMAPIGLLTIPGRKGPSSQVFFLALYSLDVILMGPGKHFETVTVIEGCTNTIDLTLT